MNTRVINPSSKPKGARWVPAEIPRAECRWRGAHHICAGHLDLMHVPVMTAGDATGGISAGPCRRVLKVRTRARGAGKNGSHDETREGEF